MKDIKIMTESNKESKKLGHDAAKQMAKDRETGADKTKADKEYRSLSKSPEFRKNAKQEILPKIGKGSEAFKKKAYAGYLAARKDFREREANGDDVSRENNPDTGSHVAIKHSGQKLERTGTSRDHDKYEETAGTELDLEYETIVKPRHTNKTPDIPMMTSRGKTTKYYNNDGNDHNNRQKYHNIYSESYSDYELYQILDESGYKPTERNLSILKEGLETGKYEIIDEGFHPFEAIKTYRSYGDRIKNAKRDVKSAVQLRRADEHILKSLPKNKRPGSLEDDDLKRETETEIKLKGKLGQIRAMRMADTLNTLKNGPRDTK